MVRWRRQNTNRGPRESRHATDGPRLHEACPEEPLKTIGMPQKEGSCRRPARTTINSISPLQEYIKKVICRTAPPPPHAGNHEAHDQSLIGVQFEEFDQKEVDFMEMLWLGYI